VQVAVRTLEPPLKLLVPQEIPRGEVGKRISLLHDLSHSERGGRG
jgi:hypothetical protein